jgi:hypothetical protein
MITTPSTTSVWQNGAANVVTWTKGLLDNIHEFDVEIARLSQDGLIFVAKDVPASPGNSLNIFLQDVPPADDYFLLFLNSTHGIMYSTSSRFTILAAGATVSSNVSHASPDPSAPTVTVSGAPDPTKAFSTTFPPSANGVRAAWNDAWSRQIACLFAALAACLFGAAWTIW